MSKFGTRNAPPSAGSSQPKLEIGREGRITGDSWSAIAGVTKADFEEIANSIRINDKMGATKAVLQGRAFFIEPNTRVLVIDKSLELVRIRVLEGPTAARDGWVLKKWVRQ